MATAADQFADIMTAAGKSPATIRTYRREWAQWAQWATSHKGRPLPAAPKWIAAYLRHRARHRATVSTLRVIAAAIAAVHEVSTRPNPCAFAPVPATLAGFARQTRAFDPAFVWQVRSSQTAAPADMAALAVLATGIKPAEAAALTWADIENLPDRSGRVTIRQSGAVVPIDSDALDDLDRAAPDARLADPILGGINARTISRRARSAVKGAGLAWPS